MATTADMVPTMEPMSSAVFDVFEEKSGLGLGLEFLESVVGVEEEEEEEDKENGVEMGIELGTKGEFEMASVPAIGEELVTTGLDADFVSVAIVVSAAAAVVVGGSDFVVPVNVVWSFVVVKESFDSSTDSLS